MIRLVQLGLAGSVLAVAVLAAAGMARNPEAGVSSDSPGLTTVLVDVGGPAWRNGVRTGDRIVELDSSDAPGGWRLVTTDGDIERITEAVAYREIHLRHLGWVVVGLILAVLAAAVAYRGAPVASLVMPISLGVAAQPLFFAGSLLATVVGGLAVFGAGGLGAWAFAPEDPSDASDARRRQRRIGSALAVSGGVLAAAWLAAIFLVPTLFDLLDGLRWPVTIVYASVGAWLVADRARLRELALGDRAPTFADLAYGVVVSALLVAAVVGLRVELLVVVVAGVFAIVAFPFWRRLVLGAFDRLVTADARRDAAINAVEAERGRLAREIHDAPLQDLAGVIRQLETVPGATAATATLRGVTAHLREVAATLHPPVLQDLGLAAAIEDLGDAHRVAHPDITFEVAIDDLTRDGPPPDDVAIAAYRVAQEAVTNAVRHSGARTIALGGVVAADTVAFEVHDDGRGYDPGAIRAARASGHFGLDSMRERSAAVCAAFEVAPSPSGTTVRFRWKRT